MSRPLFAAVACSLIYPAVLFLATRLYGISVVPLGAYALMALAGATLGAVVSRLSASKLGA